MTQCQVEQTQDQNAARLDSSVCNYSKSWFISLVGYYSSMRATRATLSKNNLAIRSAASCHECRVLIQLDVDHFCFLPVRQQMFNLFPREEGSFLRNSAVKVKPSEHDYRDTINLTHSRLEVTGISLQTMSNTLRATDS